MEPVEQSGSPEAAAPEKKVLSPARKARAARSNAKTAKSQAAAKVAAPSGEQAAQEAGTVQHQARLKAAKEAAARKRAVSVTKSWVELVRNKAAKKGGKVLLVQITSTGNKHRTFIGHEKQCAVYLEKAKRENRLREV